MTERENTLRAWRRTGPERVPFRANLTYPLWQAMGDELDNILLRHPALFPDHRKGRRPRRDQLPARQRAGEEATDAWGCTWRSECDGVTGQVIAGPLEEGWHALETYVPPDPMKQLTWGPVDWTEVRANAEEARRRGRLVSGGVDHGFLYMRLYYLRGFEDLMADMAAGDPHVRRLVEVIVSHYRVLVAQYAAMGVDVVSFGDDLGAQNASVIGPRLFSAYIAPAYRALFEPLRERNVLVFLHSDGYIMDIMDEILATGVDVINPQDLVNGVDTLAREVKGRAAIELDLDRQSLIPFGHPADIRDHVEACVRKLGAPAGGLSFVVALYPPTPPENIEALFSAVEKYRTWWRSGRGWH